MDSRRFDRLVRGWAVAAPRRQALAALAGGVVGGMAGLGGPLGASARCVPLGSPCTEADRCCAGKCSAKTGACKCRKGRGEKACQGVCIPKEACCRRAVCPDAFYPCGSGGGNCTCLATVEGDVRCADIGDTRAAQCGLGSCQSSAECETRLGPGAVCTPAVTVASCCNETAPQCFPACGSVAATAAATTTAETRGWLPGFGGRAISERVFRKP